ncbi:hypothetical protein L682_31540 [Aquipseudomonas alcaligenes OT 69]|nr:hypothetical protein L682_31540 [Pseudomonas alcaligenes OT 69]
MPDLKVWVTPFQGKWQGVEDRSDLGRQLGEHEHGEVGGYRSATVDVVLKLLAFRLSGCKPESFLGELVLSQGVDAFREFRVQFRFDLVASQPSQVADIGKATRLEIKPTLSLGARKHALCSQFADPAVAQI